MLHCALIFLLLAMLARLFGFSGLTAGALSLSRPMGLRFIGLAVAGLIVGLLHGR